MWHKQLAYSLAWKLLTNFVGKFIHKQFYFPNYEHGIKIGNTVIWWEQLRMEDSSCLESMIIKTIIIDLTKLLETLYPCSFGLLLLTFITYYWKHVLRSDGPTTWKLLHLIETTCTSKRFTCLEGLPHCRTEQSLKETPFYIKLIIFFVSSPWNRMDWTEM